MTHWPPGDGEMVERVRTHDWPSTPLGSIEQWSPALRTIVDLLLAHGFPMVLLWGPELIQIYNDGYRQILGDRHPRGLGQPTFDCWPETLDAAGPIVERARTGETIKLRDALFRVSRTGAAGDAWFTVTYSPVIGGAGVLITLFENTDKVIADRNLRDNEERQSVLLRLSDALRPLSSPIAIQGAAMRVLGAALKVNRAFYGDAENDHDTFPTEGQFRFSDFDLDMAAWYRAGRTYLIEDAQRDTRFDETAKAGFAAIEVGAAIGVPLVKDGRVRAIVSVHQSSPRRWTSAEIALVEEMAERIWAAVERARAEADLCESEARFQALFAASPVPFMVLAANPPDFTIMAANKAYHAATLTTPETLLGRRLFDVFTDDPSRPGQLGSEALDISLERVLRMRKTDAMERVRYDIRTPEGGFEEHWWLAINAPLFDATGNVIAVIHQVNRQTELHHAEQALRESEEQQRLTLQLVPAMLWWADTVGHEISSNDRWRFYTGQGETETQDFGWLDAIHPDDVADTRAAFALAFATGEPIERQQRIRQAGDGYRWHLVRHVPVRDGAREIRRWFGAAIDVHDLHELQDRQGVLVAELQHRTRNLIAVVRGLARDTMGQADSMESFSAAFNDRLSALARVQGLLSRSDAEPITIEALLRLELDALGATGAGDRVMIEGPEVFLRPSTVQTLALALHELATNARKYGALSHDGGRLAVTWRRRREADERRLMIEWEETGLEQALERSPSKEMGGGYGRELIEHALPYALGARTNYALSASGVRCTIDIEVRPRHDEA